MKVGSRKKRKRLHEDNTSDHLGCWKPERLMWNVGDELLDSTSTDCVLGSSSKSSSRCDSSGTSFSRNVDPSAIIKRTNKRRRQGKKRENRKDFQERFHPFEHLPHNVPEARLRRAFILRRRSSFGTPPLSFCRHCRVPSCKMPICTKSPVTFWARLMPFLETSRMNL